MSRGTVHLSRPRHPLLWAGPPWRSILLMPSASSARQSTSEEDELYEARTTPSGQSRPRHLGALHQGLESPTVGQILAFLTPMLLQSVARTGALGVTARGIGELSHRQSLKQAAER